MASSDSVVAFGFSLKSLSSFTKSCSLTVLVVGTDLYCSVKVSDGLLTLSPGKWSSTDYKMLNQG